PEKGRLGTLGLNRHEKLLRGRLFVSEQLSQLFHRAGLEERSQWQLLPEFSLDAAEEPDSQQGVSSQIEKIVFCADLFNAQNLSEDQRQLLLRRTPRSNEFGICGQWRVLRKR